MGSSDAPLYQPNSKLSFLVMTTFLSLVLLVFICLLFPILFLGWVTESREQKVRRLRRQGLSQRAIADRLGVSRWAVRQALVGC